MSAGKLQLNKGSITVKQLQLAGRSGFFRSFPFFLSDMMQNAYIYPQSYDIFGLSVSSFASEGKRHRSLLYPDQCATCVS